MKKRISIIVCALCVTSIGFWSCQWHTIKPVTVELQSSDTEDPNAPVDSISFSSEIQPIFDSQGCTNSSCHGGAHSLDLTVANAYDHITSRGLVNTADAPSSEIITKITGGHNSTTYTADQQALIVKWIEQGAINN